MQVTLEISMYPLKNEYEAYIIDFISRLKNNEGILVKTNAMSTYIQGEFEEVWNLLGKELNGTFESGIPVSNVIKIIPRTLPLKDNWLEF